VIFKLWFPCFKVILFSKILVVYITFLGLKFLGPKMDVCIYLKQSIQRIFCKKQAWLLPSLNLSQWCLSYILTKMVLWLFKTYRFVVGSLYYFLIIKLKLTYSVNKICQYMHNVQEHHWKVVKGILRYLTSTLNHDIILRSCSFL